MRAIFKKMSNFQFEKFQDFGILNLIYAALKRLYPKLATNILFDILLALALLLYICFHPNSNSLAFMFFSTFIWLDGLLHSDLALLLFTDHIHKVNIRGKWLIG